MKNSFAHEKIMETILKFNDENTWERQKLSMLLLKEELFVKDNVDILVNKNG